VLIRKHTRKIRAWLARRPDQKTARYTCDGLLRRRNGLKLGLIVVEIQSQEVGLYTDLQSSQEDLGRHPLEKKPTKMAFIISKNEKNGGETITGKNNVSGDDHAAGAKTFKDDQVRYSRLVRGRSLD
jgi:hypothetical protein